MINARPWRSFLAAIQFLTRIPIPGGLNGTEVDRALLRSAVLFFPLVGGLIGGVTGGVIWAAAHFLPLPIAVLIGLVIEALITGAFHEDAVADCCDAFGGGWTRDDILRILKDSRVGSFGALGLTLAVLLRAGCLAFVELEGMVAVAMASAALGRWAILIVMSRVPPLPDRQGLARDVGEQIGWFEIAFGSALMLPAAAWFAWLAPLHFACGLTAVVGGALLWARYVRVRLGGVTGDCLGFICYAGQILMLLAAVAKPVTL